MRLSSQKSPHCRPGTTLAVCRSENRIWPRKSLGPGPPIARAIVMEGVKPTTCRYCRAAVSRETRLCSTCGRLLSPDQPPDPYSPSFDPESLPDETLAVYRQHRYRATFSVVLTILIHLAGLGMLTPMAVARLYAFLPTVRADDFSARKA